MKIKIITLFLMTLVLSLPALAHGVKLFATQNENLIQGRGYFIGGSPAQEAKIVLYNNQDEPVKQAATDNQGHFSLQMPKTANCPCYLILDASMGHQARYNLKMTSQETARPVSQPSAPVFPDPDNQNDQALLKLHAKLNNLENKLVQIEEILQIKNDVTLKDIFSGFGYIVGFMGLILYFKTRKKQK